MGKSIKYLTEYKGVRTKGVPVRNPWSYCLLTKETDTLLNIFREMNDEGKVLLFWEMEKCYGKITKRRN